MSRATWAGLGRGLLALAAAVALVGSGATSCPAAKAGKVARAEAPRAAEPAVQPVVLPHRVTAYYFHTTQRCATCKAIEAQTCEAIESAFAAELKDGRLVWKVVNVEVKGNEHFVKDYALYTKSVVLVDEVRGQSPRWKNLEKVWQLVRDKAAFQRYVQAETRAYLAAGGS
jgi:hypothetical protein